MKKWLASLLTISVLISTAIGSIPNRHRIEKKATAWRMEEGINQEDEEELNLEEMQEILQTSANLTEEPKIQSRAAIVWERNTKQVLLEKNADKKVPMASTTKIMTILVVLENTKLTDVVTVNQKAAQTGRITSRIKNKRQNHSRRLTIWLDAKISEMTPLLP